MTVYDNSACYSFQAGVRQLYVQIDYALM